MKVYSKEEFQFMGSDKETIVCQTVVVIVLMPTTVQQMSIIVLIKDDIKCIDKRRHKSLKHHCFF